MQPFNYLGQDSGTLAYYYSEVLRSANGLDYVILYDSLGNRLIYATSDKSTAILAEDANYSVTLGGDFLGNVDEGFSKVSITSGDVKAGYRDASYLNVKLEGRPSGIFYDLPKVSINLLGTVESGNNDRSRYFIGVNSGEVLRVARDYSQYNTAISGGKISGILKESANYNIKLLGKVNKIYKEGSDIEIEFSGGSISKGHSIFNFYYGDPCDISFEFSNGTFYGK